MAIAPTQDVKAYKNYIGGEWVEAASGETFDVINPSSGELVATVPKGGREDAQAAIAAARESFDSGVWAEMDPDERVRILRSVVDKFTEHEDELAELESLQAGMTMRATSNVVIGYCITHWDYFARHAGRPRQEALDPVEFPTHSYNFVLREPIGVCAGIIPWNFPLVMAVWKLAPALAMGNIVRAQAGVEHAADGAAAGRAARRDRPAQGRREHHHRRRRDGRRGARLAPRRGQGLVHRLDRRRPADHAARLVHHQEDHARARRQVAEHRVRGRQPRGGGRRRAVGHLLPPGPGLRVGHPPAAAGVDPRRVRRGAGRARQADQGRRRARLRDRHGPAGLGGPARDHRELRAHRPGGGREARARRQAPGRRARRAASTTSPRSSPTSTTR